MKNLALLVAASALCVTPSLASDDHLTPAHSWLEPNDEGPIIQTVFPEAWGKTVRTRTLEEMGGLALPKSEVVFLTVSRGNYRIVDLSVPIMLMDYTASHKEFELRLARQYHVKPILPPDIHTLKITRCEIGITPELGHRILAVWRNMMLRTHYFEEPVHPVPDAGWVEFWMSDTQQTFAGDIPTSYDEPMTAKFREISYDMRAYCEQKDKASLVDLDKVVSDLARLERQNP